ncbi:methionine synthase [Mycolicibacterium thermoresistibile]|uniref:Methionine synthase, vitamin-B12 independent n=2 Tax=Mycolicibacterium thermoresistibile TaxID=1797 RepID=G7CEP3_MYCT3|nr:methionine synthase [Mycolicibacterium thermoresistibile]EHI13585.1 methionine synthase, vitamin-B12 independent [Mycolicibacterium thermoresistibile ATCC 19527]MCV7189272.1 methionine synthase [Mycolicibacterium thermoresistibile]GAT16603.1 methionine synthase, vitamin-B12 independent [Mycolicibacterium thermoresistibile]SNW17710.1 methionine synthase II (cobalamin-independent) [Mycolicibacterium thermoresistibile]
MSVFAVATGVGSWPGTSAREAAQVVVGELAGLPHLVELPERGIGADVIGRAAALLIDIGMDTVPRGYRVASRRTRVVRRAVSLLDEDLDALEEAWERAGLRGTSRSVKVQAPGPITLAAEVELANGHRAVTDTGALRDLAVSLAEGVAGHCAELARRLGCPVVVQFDEPSLPAASAGRLSGVTDLDSVPPVEEAVAVDLLDICSRTVGVPVAVHICAPGIPWKILQRSAIDAISIDPATLAEADLDGLGEFLDAGRTVQLGVVPVVMPERPPAVEEIARAAAGLTDRLGFARSVLRDRIGVTPGCGLAGASGQWARTAVELARRTAEALSDDPENI